MRRSRPPLLAVLAVLYVVSYAGFRLLNTEVWERDGRPYVIFPAEWPGRALYYFWRPMSYLDAKATGTQAHIGPHVPPRNS